jgi:hypothetical protein
VKHNLNYYWVRIFDFRYDELKAQKEEELQNRNEGLKDKDLSWLSGNNDNTLQFEDWMLRDEKGTMLDEYYLCGEALTRDECKKQVAQKSNISRFAKPKSGKSDVYALILDSSKFFYDRFYVILDTICFECGRPIKGSICNFPYFKPIHYDERWDTSDENQIEGYNDDTKYYFCSYECKYKTTDKLRSPEGEWQNREGYERNGGTYGYIYHIYNRFENKHYIGQTRYMPFFRWQEHAKSGIKGDICDLVFETICEVKVKSQEYLNSIEAWWIQSFINQYGKENVMNLTNPKVTVNHLVDRFKEMAQK